MYDYGPPYSCVAGRPHNCLFPLSFRSTCRNSKTVCDRLARDVPCETSFTSMRAHLLDKVSELVTVGAVGRVLCVVKHQQQRPSQIRAAGGQVGNHLSCSMLILRRKYLMGLGFPVPVVQLAGRTASVTKYGLFCAVKLCSLLCFLYNSKLN